jgi:hypothetical protein
LFNIKQRVMINDTQYFGNVPEAVWNFKVGGYQVCDKWLKDRKGAALITISASSSPCKRPCG